MTGCLPRSSSSPELATQGMTLKPVPCWRRRSWQVWRMHYLDDTPENRRGAWVQAEHQEEEAFASNVLRRRIALVPDISLGGLQLKAWFQYPSGTLLRVHVWDDGVAGLKPLLVRVLQVESSEVAGEWLHRCAFLAGE